MTNDNDAPETRGPREGMWRTIRQLGMAAIAVVGVYFIAQTLTAANEGGVVRVGSEGIEVEIPPETDLVDLLSDLLRPAIPEDADAATRRRIEAQTAAAAAALSSFGYIHPGNDKAADELAAAGFFRTNDSRLVDALADLKSEDPVVREIRGLLYDLRGPFALPGTLAGADKRLIDALNDLESISSKTGQISAFLTEMIDLSLDQRGVFKPRTFKAAIQKVTGAPERVTRYFGDADGLTLPVVYACSASPLIGNQISLWHMRPASDGGQEVRYMEALVRRDLQRLDCGGDGLTLSELLSNAPARIGMDARTLQEKFGVGPDEEGPIAGSFQILPGAAGWN